MSAAQAEFEGYIARAEQRFVGDSRPEIAALLAAYRQLAQRFAADLGDARDVAVSKAAALMLIQQRAASLDAEAR
jgi:hypothetical protein